MAVTYGFYNSVDHDRVYDAEQFSSIFDGIINDGVYEFVGDHFTVTPGGYADGKAHLNIGTGRAWLDHTWTYNDSLSEVICQRSDTFFTRIDAIVLVVDRDQRRNYFDVLTGVPSDRPQRPTPTFVTNFKQYPLAYVRILPNASYLSAADITNVVGTGQTPYVTGPLGTISLDEHIARYEAQFDAFLSSEQASLQRWKTAETAEFEEWFDSIQLVLDEQTAAALAGQIVSVKTDLEDLQDFLDTMAISYNIVSQDGSVLASKSFTISKMEELHGGTAETGDSSVTSNS